MTVLSYTSPGGDQLPLHVHAPEAGPPRAALILFHGGGWVGGSPGQFTPQCRDLAARGILAATAGYRLLGSGARSLDDCVDDATAAIGRFRTVAAEHGLAPDVVAAGGGSAGGHLALTAALTGGADLRALVLFNPAVDLLGAPGGPEQNLREALSITDATAERLSPIRLVRPGAPPTLVMHGTEDRVVPIDGVRRFRDRMTTEGNHCRLVEYPGAGHGFFNSGMNDCYDATVREAAGFLLSLPDGVPPT
ncbi:alpha/beta hydrolase [Streptomyces sp. NPDC048473]|uniref:alpha/beta hydrolase n=1 Tax=unclassified Streptomyces TaxID=2593676 RepID=UPI00370F78BA